MTSVVEQNEPESTLQLAGKTISLAGIVIGLVLLVLLNSGTSLEAVRGPARVFGIIGVVVVALGFVKVLLE